MAKKSFEEEFKEIEKFVHELYGDPENHVGIIPEKLQKDELERLKIGRRQETFYFVVDFLKLDLTHQNGLEELGFHGANFSYKDYLKLLPDGSMRQLIFLLGKQTFKMANRTFISFLKPKFVALVPIRDKEGKTLLCKRTISVWQMSAEGKILSYLSEFVIIKDFENEAPLPRFYDVDLSLRSVFDGLVKTIFNHLPAKENPFTHRETLLLNHYLQNGVTAKEVAEKENLSVQTVHSYNKKILTKARTFFSNEAFKSATEVADYMMKMGLITPNEKDIS
jgi:DNA-binding CsgD family transcriptional regulator